MNYLLPLTIFAITQSIIATSHWDGTVDDCNGSVHYLTANNTNHVTINMPSGQTKSGKINCQWRIDYTGDLNSRDGNPIWQVGLLNSMSRLNSFKQLHITENNPWGSLDVQCQNVFLATPICTPENGCSSNSTILPCDTFYISYTNKGIYDQPKSQPLLRQSSFETCTGDCAPSITLSKDGTPSFFETPNFPYSICNKAVSCDVSVNAPTSSDEYFIEYSLPLDGMPSIGSISNYVLYDSNMEDIQSGCKPFGNIKTNLTIATRRLCLPRTTTGAKGRIVVTMEGIGKHGEPIQAYNGVKFAVRAVSIEDVVNGTRNCYCGDGVMTVENNKNMVIKSPNSFVRDATGPCPYMFCEYLVKTADNNKVLNFHANADDNEIVNSGDLLTTLNAHSVGLDNKTHQLFKCGTDSCDFDTTSVSNAVKLIYTTSGMLKKEIHGEWRYNVTVLDTPLCLQRNVDVSPSVSSDIENSMTILSPAGNYQNRQCSIVLNTNRANLDSILNHDGNGRKVYHPTIRYSAFDGGCVEGLVIKVYDGQNDRANLVFQSSCQGTQVSSQLITATDSDLFVVWERKNADISRTRSLTASYTSNYVSGANMSSWSLLTMFSVIFASFKNCM